MFAGVLNAEGGVASNGFELIVVVIKVVLGGAVEYADGAFGDVVDVSEVALHLAVVEDVDGSAFKYCGSKKPWRHVGTDPGAIDGEVMQAGGG